MFDLVSRQKSNTSLLKRGATRSASAPRLRPPPVPGSGGGGVLSRLSNELVSRASRTSFSGPQGQGEGGGGGGEDVDAARRAALLGRPARGAMRQRRASLSGVGTLVRSSLDGVRSGGLSGGASAAAGAWEAME